MNSIQLNLETFAKNILELDIIGLGLSKYMDRAEFLTRDFLLRHVQLNIESLDEGLKESPESREDWRILKKEPRELVTKAGILRYRRRYFAHIHSNEKCFLVDKLVGVDKYERIDKSVKADICNLVSRHSYQESSYLACADLISKQSVKRIIKEVNIPEPPCLPQGEPLNVLHIQVDEDHVAMQDGHCKQHRIAVIHSPSQRRGKRVYLPQKRYVFGRNGEAVEDFWDRVWEEICKNYNLSKNCVFYIHGDGAAWIRSGAKLLPNARYVLDKYHVMESINRIAPAGSEENSALKYFVINNQRSDFKRLSELCLGRFERKEESQEQARQYCLRNWTGISIWHEDPASGSSCAEGLVSHYLSARFSSRPMAWMDAGLEGVSNLREHALNQGKIRYVDFKRKDELSQQSRMESVKLEPLRKVSGASYDYSPMPTEIFRTAKEGSLRRLQEAIKYGGLRF